ncbi:alpha/beta hydrolase [Micromonospora sp. NPDC048986]|uniref:alpha/beta hydrolase family protein n=1 Tax=Micromonospora sp. NPDC048986 TaxID=3155644 RepID=UPI003400334F
MADEVERREVAFPSGKVLLAGTVTVPPGAVRCPAVVMIGGSGPADRDNDVLFPPIRQHLNTAGFAVLSYDKRGVGGSSGDWLAGTMDDLALDAVAAVRFLRTAPAVDPDAVGLFGHSEGGWTALRAATFGAEVAFVITNGTPSVTPAEQDRYAVVNELRTQLPAADAEAALAFYDRLGTLVQQGATFAKADALVQESAPPALAAFWADVDERLWEFMKGKQNHDAIPDVVGLRCPLLAMFGGTDRVVPVADSVRGFADAVGRPDRIPAATLTIEVFPGGNHRVQLPDGSFAAGYLTTLVRWIRAASG